MSEAKESSAPDSVQEHLQEIQALLEKQRLVEGLVHKQEMPRHELVESLVHKQHVAELQKKLDSLHSADIAYILRRCRAISAWRCGIW
jgi:magnesium transporter